MPNYLPQQIVKRGKAGYKHLDRGDYEIVERKKTRKADSESAAIVGSPKKAGRPKKEDSEETPSTEGESENQ